MSKKVVKILFVSGHFRDAMRLIVAIARGTVHEHYARRLYYSMKGLVRKLDATLCLPVNVFHT